MTEWAWLTDEFRLKRVTVSTASTRNALYNTLFFVFSGKQFGIYTFEHTHTSLLNIHIHLFERQHSISMLPNTQISQNIPEIDVSIC